MAPPCFPLWVKACRSTNRVPVTEKHRGSRTSSTPCVREYHTLHYMDQRHKGKVVQSRSANVVHRSGQNTSAARTTAAAVPCSMAYFFVFVHTLPLCLPVRRVSRLALPTLQPPQHGTVPAWSVVEKLLFSWCYHTPYYHTVCRLPGM